ncbi:hypothetical protein H1C71_039954 [Ictidomys tridecemlineatus]|nr:hypothetical protein H1C71_039954 [Ictidomys tridecemlineatus]
MTRERLCHHNHPPPPPPPPPPRLLGADKILHAFEVIARMWEQVHASMAWGGCGLQTLVSCSAHFLSSLFSSSPPSLLSPSPTFSFLLQVPSEGILQTVEWSEGVDFKSTTESSGGPGVFARAAVPVCARRGSRRSFCVTLFSLPCPYCSSSLPSPTQTSSDSPELVCVLGFPRKAPSSCGLCHLDGARLHPGGQRHTQLSEIPALMTFLIVADADSPIGLDPPCDMEVGPTPSLLSCLP